MQILDGVIFRFALLYQINTTMPPGRLVCRPFPGYYSVLVFTKNQKKQFSRVLIASRNLEYS